jgi:hypothetical protein
MPVSKYFKGHGDEVMSAMTKEYGPKKGKSVFYATANKKKQTPMESHLNSMKSGGMLKSKKMKMKY